MSDKNSNTGGDKKSGQLLTPKEAYELGFQRESWCAVEMQKEEDWCRAERQHYPQQFKSSVFSSPPLGQSEPRCTFQVNAPTHRERKHFPKNYENQLKI